MTEKNLETHLTEYYEGRSMSSDKAARLASLATDSATQHEPNPAAGSSRQRARFMVAAAAVIGLAVGWIGHALTGVAPMPRTIVESQPATEDGGAATIREAIPRLVAISVRADWCSFCPLVAPVFEELKEEFGDRPIQFVVLDVTNPESSAQARYLVAGLGLDFIPKRFLDRTGAIRLVDRKSRTILASLTKPDELPTMRGVLNDALR